MNTVICNIRVMIYVNEAINTSILERKSRDYGVFGKDIVMKLRKINGKKIELLFDENTSVDDLMKRINPLYDKQIFELGTERWCIRKDDTRYFFADSKKSLQRILMKYCSYPESQDINLEFVLYGDAGDRCDVDGLIYIFHSHESGKHNKPHVHVMDKSRELNVTMDISDGSVIEPRKIIAKNQRKVKKARNYILGHRKEMFEKWKASTDGFNVEIDPSGFGENAG